MQSHPKKHPTGTSAAATSPEEAPRLLLMRKVAWFFTLLYVLVVALIVLWPTHVDAGESGQALKKLLDAGHAAGWLPAWFRYTQAEWLSNVVMFLPGGFFFTLLMRTDRTWLVPLGGLLATCTIETAQLFMPGRTSSLLDVLANSLGAVLGWCVGLVVLRRLINTTKTAPISGNTADKSG